MPKVGRSSAGGAEALFFTGNRTAKPELRNWIPAFAGMTSEEEASGAEGKAEARAKKSQRSAHVTSGPYRYY
jgi:hypothetical protein